MDSGWFSTYPSNRYKNVQSPFSLTLSSFNSTWLDETFILSIYIYIYFSSYIRSSNSVRRSIYVHSIFDCVKMLSKRQRQREKERENRELTGQHIRTCNKVPFDRSFNAIKANINEFPFSWGIWISSFSFPLVLSLFSFFPSSNNNIYAAWLIRNLVISICVQ